MKKLYIKTYGCQMNAYDSARMADVMAPHGYAPAAAPEEADLVVLNTCHIREKAAEKVFSDLGRLRRVQRARADGRRMLVAVAGCVAQAEGEELRRRAPNVDVVLGPQTYHRLPELVARAQGGERPIDTEFPAESKFDHLPEESAAPGASAFVAVQEGCDKFCTFCVVPYTRGAERSRPAAAIVADAARLIARGAVELTLIGQNVNAWHGEGPDGRAWSFARLLHRIAALPGLLRLRYTTSHPLEMDDALIAAHGEIALLAPLLHLPVQSGADRILAAMNRRHSAADYRRTAASLRAARPGLALSTDLIVGFPGESEADFAATLELVEEIGFVQAFSFKYSARPGTPAAALLPRQVPDQVKAERLDRLQALLRRQQTAFNEACRGRTLQVLLDRPGRYPGQLAGRSEYLQPVHVFAPVGWLGRLAPIAIEAVHSNSLVGRAIAAAVPDAA